jgi:hypothetical protein
MKRTLLFIILIAFTAAITFAQDRVTGNKPYSTLGSDPGFIVITEINGGIGLGVTDVDYSKSFFGVTAIGGYLINKSFLVGAGTGLSFYNGGMLVPLFLDFRYTFSIAPVTPYLFADGGLLLNVSDFAGTKLFINPGAGARYVFSRKVAVNLGLGMLIQQGSPARDSFVNIKMGMIYKF